MFNVQEMVRTLNARLLTAVNGETAKGVSTDTRTLQAGDLYFALEGPRFNGHDFVSEAFKRGACGAVVERVVSAPGPLIQVADTLQALGALAMMYRLMLPARVTAVTGSNGKTTTKEMVAHILSKKYRVISAKGSFNNFVGVPLTLFAAEAATEHVVLEIGTNHPGEMARLGEVARPDAAVITSIAQAHLEGLGSLEGVAREKASLLEYLRGGGFAVVTEEALSIKPFVRLPVEKIITVGLSKAMDLCATDVEAGGGRLRFLVRGTPFYLGLYGRWNIVNAMAACAVAMPFGVSLDECASFLADFRPPKMRMERLDLGGVTIINDAYNANPASMKAALEEFAQMPAEGNKIVFLGDMKELGTESPRFHEEIGRWIADRDGIDVVVGVGTEMVSALEAIDGSKETHRFTSVDEVRGVAASLVRPGDLVLLKGSRAMALEKVVKFLGEALL